MPKPTTSLSRLSRVARYTGLRLRVNRLVSRFFMLLPIPLVYGVGALTAIKALRLPPDTQETLLWVGLIPVAILVGGSLQSWFARRPPHAGALALDRHHGLHDRITNALTFRSLTPPERTALMDAAIEDALSVATDLRPRRAAPLHLPREIPIVALLVGALVGISVLEVRTTRELPPEQRISPLVMAPDDVELFRDMAKELEQNSQDPEALAAARRFNQLIEDIAHRRLDRREVFKRLEALERELLRTAEAEKEALEQGLGNVAEELARSDLSKPVAEALKEKRLADAEEAMRKLAERLKKKQKPPSKAQLEKLRDALRKASQTNSERSKQVEQERQQLEEQRSRLLKKKQQQDGGLSKQDQNQLRKLERRLERLDREKDRLSRAQRQLSELDRQLAKAAEDLMREMGLSAEDLEAAAQDINRMSGEQMSRQEKESLRRRLQELRELLRQQGKGGQARLKQMMRFGQRARGSKPGQGGKPGQGQEQRPGGQGRQPGDGPLVLGPGSGDGAPVPLPGQGSAPGSGSMPGQGQGDGPGGQGDKPGGDGTAPGGESWGTGHDPNMTGDQSEAKGSTQDVTAAASDTGEGAASAEVIYGAAQRGFVGRGYQKVYTDYRNVAEQVMSQDEIPPGHRFYVQRYFQLIRPRE